MSPRHSPSEAGSESAFGSPLQGRGKEDKENNQAADSPLFEPMSTSRSPSPARLDGLQRARELKASLTNDTPALLARKNKKAVEDDPENRLIKELRQTHHMEWTAIANYLNEERLKRGEPPTITQPAVYSRFVRNAPRIAAANGEVGFDPKDYMYLRHPHHYPSEALGIVGGKPILSTGSSKFRKRVRGSEADGDDKGDVEKEFPKELSGNLRKRSKLAEECVELETEEKTAQVVAAVATIQRNFWTFVADELERTTGKLYDPKAICGRFSAI